MATHSDVLIIGGGIAGIGAAARLADTANVTVLESETALGYHSTGRSAAIFIKNYGNSTVRILNAASEPELIQPELVSDFSLLSPRGEMLIACEEDMAALDAYLDNAEDMERLTPKEAGELVPILNTDRLAGAAIERGAQEIDVDRLLQGYVRLGRTRGVKIVNDTSVTGLSRDSGQWIVETTRDKFVAPIVVNAAGAWADDIARKAGLAPLGLQGFRRSAALIPAPDGHDTSKWPLFAAASETFYAKPEAGNLMVSPADEDPVEPHDVWADDMVLAEGLYRYEQAVNVPVTRVLNNWAGLRTFAPDRIPVVGFDPRENGFFWLAGQGGYGIQTAPALSRLSANLIAEIIPGLGDDVVAALSPSRLLKG
jgi:D-arginine dehydrogenase